MERLDESLDTALAAGLAALAIAVATFLISMMAPLADDIRQIRNLRGAPDAADEKRLSDMGTVVKQLIAAFYVFVGMLVTSLTLDQWEEPGAWLGQYEWADGVDVALSGGALTAGVILLALGTTTLRGLVIDHAAAPHETKTAPEGTGRNAVVDQEAYRRSSPESRSTADSVSSRESAAASQRGWRIRD